MDSLKKQLKIIEKGTECVVLIHGLARTSRCMNKAALMLSSYGYDVVNINYPSRRNSIEQLVRDHIQPVMQKNEIIRYEKVHFLTHSMGGILLRYYLFENRLGNLARTVMLAPPNLGSELVDKLAHLRLFIFINGPAGMQLGTNSNSLPNQLGAVNFDLGVIAGNRRVNPLLSLLIPGDNDGKVAVKKTRIAGMKDFILLPYTHSFIMQKTHVIQQAIFYLQHGFFYR